MSRSGHVPRWLATLLAVLCLALAVPAAGGILGGQLKSLLGKASDKALDKLAEPGRFMSDFRVRIGMPGGAKQASELARLADQAGLTNALVESLNTAAELAAAQAKPIFRDAIDGMAVKGSFAIVGEDEAATRYLRKYAYGEIRARLRPLVQVALDRTGAFSRMSQIAGMASGSPAAGMSREDVTDSVTDQALEGMFKYITDEEQAIREDPLDGLFKGL